MNNPLTHMVTLQFAVSGEADAQKLIKHLDDTPSFIHGLKKAAGVGKMINFTAVNNAEMQPRTLMYVEKELIAEALGADSVEL